MHFFTDWRHGCPGLGWRDLQNASMHVVKSYRRSGAPCGEMEWHGKHANRWNARSARGNAETEEEFCQKVMKAGHCPEWFGEIFSKQKHEGRTKRQCCGIWTGEKVLRGKEHALTRVIVPNNDVRTEINTSNARDDLHRSSENKLHGALQRIPVLQEHWLRTQICLDANWNSCNAMIGSALICLDLYPWWWGCQWR